MKQLRVNGPDEFTLQFFKDLVAHLGGDASKVDDHFCWREFGKTFPKLVVPAMEFFENATTGDPADAAYWLVRYCDAPLAWAMRLIENATAGDPARAAYWLVRDCGAPLDWAMEIIENAKIGHPASVASWLVKFCGAPLAWAMRVVENATTRDPAWAAYWLRRYCEAPPEWAMKVKKKWEVEMDSRALRTALKDALQQSRPLARAQEASEDLRAARQRIGKLLEKIDKTEVLAALAQHRDALEECEERGLEDFGSGG